MTRAAAARDVGTKKRQVSAFLLRHSRLFPRQKSWGARYRCRLQAQSFEHPADQIVLQELVEDVRLAEERRARIERAIEEFLPTWGLNCIGIYSGNMNRVVGQFSIDAKSICDEPRVDTLLTVVYATADANRKVTQYISGPYDLGRPHGCPRSKTGGTNRAPAVIPDKPATKTVKVTKTKTTVKKTKTKG